jgi:predicted DNA-binding transcriptional regulator YafY
VLERTEDGGLELCMNVGSTAEVRNWILSFGSNALVLEPESLREEIAQELRAACANYSSDENDPGNGESSP